MVKIFNSSGALHQIFDTTIEGKVYVAASKIVGSRTFEETALLNIYGAGLPNLFGAPWMGNTNTYE